MRGKTTLLLAVAQLACRTATVYRPAGAAAGVPITPSYDLPSAAPKGNLQVVTLGGERLPVGPGAPEVYLHLRLLAENQSDPSAWVLDPNEQLLTFNGQTLPPSYSQASGAGPVLSLARGERGFLDVYFPLPELDPERVSLAWRLRRGGEVLAALTSFDRVSGRTEVDLGDEYYETGASFGLGLGWFVPDYCWRWHGGYLAPYVARRGGEHPSSRRTWVPPAGDSSSSSSNSSTESSSSSSSSDSSSASSAAPSSSSSSSSDDAAKSAWRGGGHH